MKPRWVWLLTGFLLPLILGALLFALCDGWRDGMWLEQWGTSLPMVSVVMGLPTLLYTISMEVAGTSMQRRGIYNPPVLIGLSTFLGLLAGGLFGDSLRRFYRGFDRVDVVEAGIASIDPVLKIGAVLQFELKERLGVVECQRVDLYHSIF